MNENLINFGMQTFAQPPAHLNLSNFENSSTGQH